MKKNLMKRAVALVLSSVLLLSSTTPIVATEVQSENQIQEGTDQKFASDISKNELDKIATVLDFNTPTYGALSKYDASDYFKFTIKENGYFNVKFDIASNATSS